jgi:asparagine synthase (glutamine-hydrolysing)
VILAGYERWGADELLRRLDGMYAFALFDCAERTLYLARDPFGKKPCYYWYDAPRHRLAFSSDPRSFLTLQERPSLDAFSLGYFLAELSTPERRSIWREVCKLPGGHALRFSSRGLDVHRFWRFRFVGQNHMAQEELIEEAGRLLDRAVRKRLVGDVRCAALLSGGLDSSLVVASMARQSPGRVPTYTVGFDTAGFDERPFARLVAERWDTDHHEVVVEARSVSVLRSLVAEFGEPFADCSALPTYLVARTVAANEKVVLTGDGGDELFAGYFVYYFAHRLDAVKRFGAALPLARALEATVGSRRLRLLRELLEAARLPPHALLDRRYGFSADQIQRLAANEPRLPELAGAMALEHERVWQQETDPGEHRLLQLLTSSLHTRLANDYLVKVDRATMFASLEARSPLLDLDLARFAQSLRPGQLYGDGRPKAILRALALRQLPAAVAGGEKRGFAVPVADWLRDGLRSEFEATVLEGKQDLVRFDYGWIQTLFRQHLAGADHTHRLWALYIFHLWAQGLGAKAH